MSYTVDYDELENLQDSCYSAISTWAEGLSSVMERKLAIEESKNISGNSAERMRQYLGAAYPFAAQAAVKLIELFRQNFLLYIDDYYRQIDSSEAAHIEESELDELRGELHDERLRLQQTGLAAEKSVGKVSDLISLTGLDVGCQDSELDRVIKFLDELDSDVNELESSHVSADFAEMDGLITELENFLTELIKENKEFKVDFTLESFVALGSAQALYKAMKGAENKLLEQKNDVKAAVKSYEKRLEREREEFERRREEAEWAKIGVNVAVGIISAVALATAGPVGAIVVSTVSGAVRSGFSAAADEYVEHGWDMQDWDASRISVHGCIGAITGMMERVIPGTGIYAQAGISGVSAFFEGAAVKTYDQLSTYGCITDLGEITSEAIIRGGSTFAGSLVGGAASEKIGNAIKSNKTIKYLHENVVGGAGHFGAAFQVDAGSKLGSGMAERFTETAVKNTGYVVSSVMAGSSFADAYKENRILGESVQEAFDYKKMTGDVAAGAGEAAMDDPLRDSLEKLEKREDNYYVFGDSPDLNGKGKAWDDWNSEEYDRMMAKLAEMDERGDDGRNYEIFGDPRTFESQRSAAVRDAWEQERRLVLQGRGTRDWSVSQQEELIRTGKVSGFEGQHMHSADSTPSQAANPDNIQFLTYEEHLYGAHGGDFRNPSSGRFDPATGETEAFSPRAVPHREQVSFELSRKFSYEDAETAEKLGSDFGYGRKAVRKTDESGRTDNMLGCKGPEIDSSVMSEIAAGLGAHRVPDESHPGVSEKIKEVAERAAQGEEPSRTCPDVSVVDGSVFDIADGLASDDKMQYPRD